MPTLGTWSNSSASGSDTHAHTVPAGSDRLGVVHVSFHYTAAPSSVTATFDGVAMTAFASSPAVGVPGVGSELAIYSFYMLEADLPASGSRNVVVTVTGGTGLTSRTIAVNVCTDCKQVEPTYGENSGEGSTTIQIPSGTIAVKNGGVGLSYVGGSGTTAWSAISANWAERFDANDGAGGDYRVAGGDRTYSSDGTDAVTWTQGAVSDLKVGVITAIDPVDDGPPPPAATMIPSRNVMVMGGR